MTDSIREAGYKREEFKRYISEKRDFLINKRQDDSINLSKLIITLSTGSIVFSASLIRNGERTFGGGAVSALILCWVSLGISIVMGVLFLKKVLEETGKTADLEHEYFINYGKGGTEKALELYNKILPEIKKRLKKYFNWQFWTFLSGLILLGIHCIIMLV